MAVFSNIKGKILVFAILATLIPALGLGLLSFRQNEALIADNVSRELRALAGYAGRELEMWTTDRVRDVRAISASNPVIDGLSAQTRSPERPVQDLTRYLESVQHKLDPLLELTVVDTGGRIVASSASVPDAVAMPESWPQRALTEGMIVVPPHRNSARDTVSFSVAVPVLSFENELLGALVAVLDLHRVQPYLKSAVKSPSGEVLLLDEQGVTLLGSYAENGALPSLSADQLQGLLSLPGETMVYEGPARREVIGLAEMSTALPVTVVAERDRAEVYLAWVKQRNLFLKLVGALALAVALIAYRLGRAITFPLHRLIGAADRIAEGDLDVHLKIRRDDELGHLTRVFNQMADKLRSSHDEVVAANQMLQQQNRLLEALSTTDNLTGLYNRNKLDEILSDEIARFQRSQRPFAVMILDIDHFKTLNDNRGHVAGDELLAAVAGILRQSIRSVDYAARYGGDEFVVILVDTTTDAAWETAERIRAEVEGTSYSAGDERVTVTVSIGIATWQAGDQGPTGVFSRADQALYQAKRAGRNRVHCAA